MQCFFPMKVASALEGLCSVFFPPPLPTGLSLFTLIMTSSGDSGDTSTG